MISSAGIILADPAIGTGGALNGYPLALVVVSPQYAIAAAEGAIASGDRTDITDECPTCSAAMT